MATKNYTRAELEKLVNEFTSEFDALVKSEVNKGQTLQKSEDGDSKSKEKPKEEASSGGDSDGSSGGDKSPPPPSGGDSSGGDASAGGPPPADPASAGAPPTDPASAGGVPPADPAAGAAGGDPVQALVQAYGQLSTEELQNHFFALQQVLQAQQAGGAGAGAPPVDPAAAAGAAPAGAPAPAAPAAPPGPGAAAPLAGEASKPVDPMASAALKSLKEELDLTKSERDGLKKSLETLSTTLEKFTQRPERKAIQATDTAALSKSEPKKTTMTRQQILQKLTVVAANPELKKSDRSLINKYCVGGVGVDAITHLLA